MRKLLVILSFCVFSIGAIGQQLPQYSHYVFNYVQQNPAAVGTKSCLALNLGYREQWVNFDGAPKSAFANLHARMGEKRFTHQGVGVIVDSDDTGPLSYTQIAGAYAYHFKVNRKAMMAFGVSAGFMQYRVDLGAVTLPQTGVLNDPALNAGRASELIAPQVDFGWMYYKEDRFLGLTIKQLTRNTIASFGRETRLQHHYIIAGGKTFELDGAFTLKPSFNFRYARQSKPGIDVNCMVDYSEKVALGLGVRNGNGINGLIRINLYNYVDVGYAYDLTMSKIKYGGRHTHEIVLGIKACGGDDKHGIPCSAYN
jgi:type IX secretion system PorP/SprF family membrane protein